MDLTPSDRIKYIRQFYELSITALAEKLGMSQPYLSQVENGTRAISQNLADRIRATFPTINKKWLLTGEGQPWDQQIEPTNLLLKDGLDILRAKGIQFKEEINFLLSLTQQAWSISSVATPDFMIRTAEAIDLLLNEAKLSKKLKGYLESNLAPGSGYDLDIQDRPSWIMAQIRKGEPIHPDYLVRSLLALVEEGEYKEYPLDRIVDKLTPWVFWVARRGQLGAVRKEHGEPFSFNPTRLLDTPTNVVIRQDEVLTGKMFSFNEEGINLDIYIGQEISGALRIEFSSQPAECILLTLDDHSILALVQLMKNVGKDSSASAGHWELSITEATNSLRYRSAEVLLQRGRLSKLSSLARQIEADTKYYPFLVKNAVDRYGVT